MPVYKSWKSDDPELKRLYNETDLTSEEIGARLGRSGNAVRSRIRLLRKKGELSEERPGVGDTSALDASPKVKIEVKDNEQYLEYKGGRIKTLEDLLAYCEVDLSVWEVDHYLLNKWEVGAKFGVKGNEEIVVEPLFQVKVWLVRKKPIAVDPVVSPVELTVTPAVKAPLDDVYSPELERALILPDIQFGFMKSLRTGKLVPFHDRAALDIALQIAQDYAFDTEVILGDLMDLADWSNKFARTPNFYWTTQPAAIEAKWWLTQFRMADPGARMSLLEGNHEQRMPKQLLEHLKEAYGLRSVDALDLPPLMTIPRILALHELDIEWIEDFPNGQVWINDWIVCEHGPLVRTKSGATVSALIQEIQETHIIGHNHRVESASKTLHTRKGQRTVEAWSMGCLCRVDGVVPGKKARQNWQQAIGIVDYYPNRSEHQVMAVKINGGKALYGGKLYEARPQLQNLKRDIKKLYPEDEPGWRF
jgi:hypothetical protein